MRSQTFLIAALAVTANAHGMVKSIEGANGVSMPGLSVADGTPRDCSSNGCGSQADTAIIRDREISSGETFLIAALAVTANAHGMVKSIEGANGVSMPGLSVADGTPRDCSSNGCGSQADTAIIRDREISSGEQEELMNIIAELGGHFPFELTDDEKRMQTELMEAISKNDALGYSRTAGSGLRVPNHTDLRGEPLNGSGNPSDGLGGSPLDNDDGTVTGDLTGANEFWNDPDDDVSLNFKGDDDFGMDLTQ
ncbi:hypothetical protein HYQ44_015113 [Verticillium longisporum]|nr:hypothetical protein HYQ44_015113 [Verticillium longisporum]